MPASKKLFLREKTSGMVRDWSVPRQLAGEDPFGSAAESEASRRLRPRLEEADRIGTSICPYCAVGCPSERIAHEPREISIHWTGHRYPPVRGLSSASI